MSTFQLLFFKEDNGQVPAEQFLDDLPQFVKEKFVVRMHELRLLGNELRRPKCDFLKEGIYELRVRYIKTQYRLLYFFQEPLRVVVSHGCIKEWRVPPVEIERAVSRQIRFQQDPVRHTYLPLRWLV